MNYFFDNCLSFRIAHALEHLMPEDTVKALRDVFDESTPDTKWLLDLSAKGRWAIISSDLIYKQADQRRALVQSGHVLFVQQKGWFRCPPLEQAWRLLKRWPEIAARAREAPARQCHLVPVKGKLRRVGL